MPWPARIAVVASESVGARALPSARTARGRPGLAWARAEVMVRAKSDRGGRVTSAAVARTRPARSRAGLVRTGSEGPPGEQISQEGISSGDRQGRSGPKKIR